MPVNDFAQELSNHYFDFFFFSYFFALSSSSYYYCYDIIVCMDIYIYMSYIDICVYSYKDKRTEKVINQKEHNKCACMCVCVCGVGRCLVLVGQRHGNSERRSHSHSTKKIGE